MVTNQKARYIGWWRSTQTPSKGIPLGGRSVGRAIISPDWTHPEGQIQWYNIYWGISGQVSFLVNEKTYVLSAEQLMIHPPGARLKGCPNEGEGEYRWLTVDGQLSADTIKFFGFKPLQIYPLGRCPAESFDQLTAEIQDITPAGEYRAGMAAYEILSRAGSMLHSCSPSSNDDPRVQCCLRLIDNQYSDPDLTVNRLASELKFHRSVLSRAFRKAVGLTLTDYIQRLRIRRAISLLRTPSLTIRQVAFASGFTDPAYFSRCIFRHTGHYPSQLRKTL